ncbi:MAG: hypothetical protein Q7J29_15640 [Stagnimonas sp.]|nr:hypothetical protein [Stagnimonas sp.]
MKSPHVLAASFVVAAALLSGCNDTNAPQAPGIITTPTNPPINMSISQFVASLIAMVTGSACNTATPASLDGVTLTDDMESKDANTLTVNCAS